MVCTMPDITPISRSVMAPSAAATRTMVQTSASSAVSELRVAAEGGFGLVFDWGMRAY